LTLFGRTLDGQEIAFLVSLLLVLVLWISVWRGNKPESEWPRNLNAEPQARPRPEIPAEKG